MPDILWCYAFCWAIYVMNHRYNRSIDNLPIVKWCDGNYELHTKDLFIFSSKVCSVTKVEAKKQLQARTEKDPRDYIGITIDEDELPQHVDGYFFEYAITGWYDALPIFVPAGKRYDHFDFCWVKFSL